MQLLGRARSTIDNRKSAPLRREKGQAFEVTPFRGPPDLTALAAAKCDAEMRDFTVNALFYDPRSNEVLDFVGGVQDLQGTAAERIWAELHKMGKAEERRPGAFAQGMALAARLALLRYALPELYPDMQGEGMGRGPPAGEDADQELGSRLAQLSLPTHIPACLRLAACLPPGVESDKYEALGRRLKMSGKELKSLLTLHRLNRLSKEEASGPAPRPLDWARFYAEDSAAGVGPLPTPLSTPLPTPHPTIVIPMSMSRGAALKM
eukprot:jgi/Botrbrau1/18439/Bobra.0072s0027.2